MQKSLKSVRKINPETIKGVMHHWDLFQNAKLIDLGMLTQCNLPH